MTLNRIAYQNLKRRKGKAAFILAGLIVGVSTVVTIVTLVEAMTRDVTEKLEKFGANILIVPKTENLNLSYGGISLGGVSFEMQEIQQAQLERLNGIENAANVAAVGPLVLGVVALDKQKVLLAGADFTAARILKPWWKFEGRFPAEKGVLLGAQVAQLTRGQIGSQLMINGQPFRVDGILRPTGSQDDQLVFTRLGTAQALLGKPGRISMAEVAALCSACPIQEMVRQISAVLPDANVMAIQQVVESRMETLAHFKKFGYGISVVVMLVGSLVVLVTMMGSVRERKAEIGIFRAIGFRKRHIMRILFTEAGVISGLAGLLGYALGFGVSWALLGFFTQGRQIALPFDNQMAAGAVLLATTIGLLASFYPAWTAARLDPNDALRAL